MTQAVGTPLADLNLLQPDIPAVLLQAQKMPYELPVAWHCQHIQQAIDGLDEVLAPDVDSVSPDKGFNPFEFGENTAIGAVQRTAEGLIPFRSWVRKLSGAEKRTRQVNSSIASGTVRRAFLKGVRLSRGCPVPENAAPHPNEGAASGHGGL
jgi:hypothetical protein